MLIESLARCHGASQCGHGRGKAQGHQVGEGGEKLSYKNTSLWHLDPAGHRLFSGGLIRVWCRTQQGPVSGLGGGGIQRTSGPLRGARPPSPPWRRLGCGIHTCFCCPRFWMVLALFHPLPPTAFPSLETDTPEGPFPPLHISSGSHEAHLTQEVHVALALCQRLF